MNARLDGNLHSQCHDAAIFIRFITILLFLVSIKETEPAMLHTARAADGNYPGHATAVCNNWRPMGPLNFTVKQGTWLVCGFCQNFEQIWFYP
ncbi:MAG: hypothetical protein ACU84Q_17020 [Gammaproteobacteria bacterium]